MKKILMAAVALTALTATPAMAEDVGTTFAVGGTVTGKCTIGTGAPFLLNSTGAISGKYVFNLAGSYDKRVSTGRRLCR